MLEVTPAWKSTYPEAHVGVLVMRGVANPVHHPDLNRQKTVLEEQVRAQFAGQDRAVIASHPVLQAYSEYYRRFKKTYHIQLQLESLVLKGKSIPNEPRWWEPMSLEECRILY